MDTAYFFNLANYHVWCAEKVVNWLNALPETSWQTPVVSSFSSIQKTVEHMVGAEQLWLQRWQGQSAQQMPEYSHFSKPQLISYYQQMALAVSRFIQDCSEQQLNSSFAYTRLNGDHKTMLYGHSFAHVINHATFHRGQLVTLLRQVGFTQVQATDLLYYFDTL